MKLISLITAAATAGLVVLVAVLAIRVSDLSGTVRDQKAAYTRQLSREHAQMASVTARTSGSHRDLITCADLQYLAWQVTGTDSLGGSIQAAAGPGPAGLPQHCLNP